MRMMETVALVGDVVVAAGRVIVARARKLLDSGAPVFSFADELDFARFSRELHQPVLDPDMRRLLDEGEREFDLFLSGTSMNP